MRLEPRLLPVGTARQARGVVLVLHGGASRRENMAVSPAQLSVLRTIPIARRIAREGGGELAVFRLLNSRRGWATEHTPVDDVRWALEQIPRILRRSLPVSAQPHRPAVARLAPGPSQAPLGLIDLNPIVRLCPAITSRSRRSLPLTAFRFRFPDAAAVPVLALQPPGPQEEP